MEDLDALLADLQESVYCQSQGFDLETTPNKQTKGEQCFCEKSEYGIFNGRSIVTGPHCFTKNERGPFPLPINSDKRNNRKAILQSFSNQSSDFLSRPFNFNLSSSQLLNNQILKRGNSLSELDSLLLDLNSARYNFENKKDYAIISNIEEKPSRNRIEMAVEKTFGDEEENISEHITSNMSSHKFPTFGQQVTVTVGEIKTENRQVEDSVCSVNGNNQKMYTYPSKDSYSATKELDDLMASLSDIKFNSGSHHHQTVTDYAELNKGISQLTKAATDSSTFKKDSRVDRLDSMLGNLQANMSRQGVNTIQKGCCFACEKPIVGQVITALEKTWHPEHFTCHHCNQELGTRNFFERDGFPYCELDYHSLFSPRCAYCNGAILDKCVTALDKTWHTEHFFCTQCGQQFGEDGFHEREGKPYCRNDYFEMFAPKCNGCNRAIMENYISALNSQWHPDCFVCRDCKKAVRGKSFYAMEGKPVCPTCVGVEEEE